MIRSSDAANAEYTNIFVLTSGIQVQRRLEDGVAAIGVASTSALTTFPIWLRMEHLKGQSIASYSADGVTWTVLASMAQGLRPTSRIGLAVTSHKSGSLSTVTFDNLTTTATGVIEKSVVNLAEQQVLAGLVRPTVANPGYVIEETGYDAMGLVTTRTDGRGVVAKFVYDTQARLISQTEAFGTADAAATTSFSYDAQGNRTRMVDPRTIATAMTYTDRNLLATSVEAFGTDIAGTTTYTYSPTRNVASVTDARGFTTVNGYGVCCDRLVLVTDPKGFITRFAYDPVGNRTAVTDANGLTTITAYDGRKRPVSVTNAAGEKTTLSYLDGAASLVTASGLNLGASADGSAVIATNPANEVTTEIRDGLGRPVRRIDALGHATTMAYDTSVIDAGVTLIAAVATDAVHATTTALADGAGRVRVSLDALGKRSTAGFDAAGNRVTWRDANGIGQDCVFDARNRDVQCADTAGTVTAKAYDGNGNLVATIDSTGATESHVYDARNRKTKTTDRVQASTTFAYDLVGNLIQIVDAEGGVTDYGYDVRNLLETEVFPTGQQGRTARTYTYDQGRRLTLRTVQAVTATGSPIGASEVTSYAYDNANRLTTRSYADGKNDGFGYDAASRLTLATSGRYANQVRRGYDHAGRLTSEILAFTSGAEMGIDLPITYAYDDANRVTSLTAPDHGIIRRDYTARGELFHVWDDGKVVSARSYDDAGRLVQNLAGNGLTESRTYIANDNLVATIRIPGVTDFTYTYDTLKRKTAEIDGFNADQTQRFSYDGQSRLTDWKRTGALPTDPVKSAQTWTLSPVGDWKQTTTDGAIQTRTHSAVHELLSINGTTLLYDLKGNLTQDDQGQVFTWDPENRLASASNLKQIQGDSAVYAYDALGRRVRKAVSFKQPPKADGTPVADTVVPTVFVSAGAQEIQEITGDLTAFNEPAADPEDAGIEPFDPATGKGARGSLLPDASGRVNFQPSSTDTPDGWSADLGTAANPSGLGWLTSVASVDRDHLGRPLYDSFAPIGTSTWEIPVPEAGTYAVAIMCGDADSRAQTNHLVVEGVAVRDQTPYDGHVTNGYETGSFDGYAITATVTDGKLTIMAASDALNPKICFIEIGKPGSIADQALIDRAIAAADKATKDTAKPKAKTPPVAKRNVWGSYVDELISITTKQPRKAAVRAYSHLNHLYSVAAITSAKGSVVERWIYNAYGVSAIKNSANVTIEKSAVGNDRGFTGYKLDNESGLCFARARMYSARKGNFISRNSYLSSVGWKYTEVNGKIGLFTLKNLSLAPSVYHDGMTMYIGGIGAYQVNDPTGEPLPAASVGVGVGVAVGEVIVGTEIGAGVIAAVGTGVIGTVGIIISVVTAPLAPPGNCTSTQYDGFKAAVDKACHGPSFSCDCTMSCDELKKRKAMAIACYAARSRINKRCFDGGDPGHQQAQEQAANSIGKCIRALEAKGCP
jgi:YD repeat-containing protein